MTRSTPVCCRSAQTCHWFEGRRGTLNSAASFPDNQTVSPPPQALRSAALRKAWTADPLIRDFVNSLDYGWDFNTPGGLPHGFSDTLGVTGEALDADEVIAAGKAEAGRLGQFLVTFIGRLP